MKNHIDSEYWQLIWKNFKEGDRNAFQTIYNEFIHSLYSYGSRITNDKELIKDSIQDTFIDVYTYGSTLRKPELLEFYLFKSLKRQIIRKLIERSKYTSNLELLDNFSLKFSIEDEIIDEEVDWQLKELQEIIKGLDKLKRELLFLKFNSGLSYIEIGKLLDIKPNTVKKQVYRILKDIRKKLNGNLLLFLVLCCTA